MSDALLAWLGAFAFTQAIEAPIYMRFAGASLPRALVPTALTHPIVWFGFFHPALPLGWLGALVLAETFAWLAEAAYLRLSRPRLPKMTTARALGVSLAANGTSLGLGLLSRALFGFP